MRQKGIWIKRGIGIVFAWIFVFCSPLQARSGIYLMVDSNGIYHFTNVPTSGRYRIYIKENSIAESKIPNRSYMKAPSQYEDIIRHYARKYGVESALVKAVILVESGFNPDSVSREGAKGLMQLMPETSRDLLVRDVFDPDENIRAGVKYLKMLLEWFDGDLPLSLAAYNAGVNLVKKYGRIPPYRETRDYIRKVLAYYRLYR